MDKRAIIFRADGNSTIGMGHFIRTLALAEMLNDNFHCIYATQTPTNYQKNEIENICHERINLPNNETHFNVFLSHIKGDEIVVLDNYYFSTDYQKAIKAKGCKLVCIDDMHDKHFVADIVINHAEGIEPNNYSIENNTTLLLGYKYALLRSNYLQNEMSRYQKKYSGLIIMGGADPLNLTTKILSLISKFQFEKPLAVVTHKSYEVNGVFKNKSYSFFNSLSASKILKLMQTSEFGIFPASTVAIEACAARLPFICGYFIDNQKESYIGINKSKLAICVDNFMTIKKEKFIEAINKVNKKDITDQIILRQVELLDKNSKNRYIKIFKNL